MTFKVGQKVVYPNYGVTLVEDVASTELDGVKQEFYHLRVLAENAQIMVPTGNSDLVRLRPLGTEEEINNLLDLLEDGHFDTYKDWKGRYKQNLDKMRTGRLHEVCEVLKNLRLVASKKTLSFREKKMYERSKSFVVSEIAHVKEIDESEAEQIVEAALDAGLAKLQKKNQMAS